MLEAITQVIAHARTLRGGVADIIDKLTAKVQEAQGLVNATQVSSLLAEQKHVAAKMKDLEEKQALFQTWLLETQADSLRAERQVFVSYWTSRSCSAFSRPSLLFLRRGVLSRGVVAGPS